MGQPGVCFLRICYKATFMKKTIFNILVISLFSLDIQAQNTDKKDQIASTTNYPIQFNFEIKANQQMQLNWQIADESDIVSYIIEKSDDGSTYSAAGEIMASGKESYYYQTPDKENTQPVSFYRIAIVQYNWKFIYSNVIIIPHSNSNDGERIKVMNNPGNGLFRIQIADQTLLNTKAYLYNAGGKLLKEIVLGNPNQLLSLQYMVTGTYYLSTQAGTKKLMLIR